MGFYVLIRARSNKHFLSDINNRGSLPNFLLKYFNSVDGCKVLLISDGTQPHQKLFDLLYLLSSLFLLTTVAFYHFSLLGTHLAAMLVFLSLVMLAFFSALAEPQPTSYLLRLKKAKPPKPSPVGFTLYHWKEDLYWAVENTN